VITIGLGRLIIAVTGFDRGGAPGRLFAGSFLAGSRFTPAFRLAGPGLFIFHDPRTEVLIIGFGFLRCHRVDIRLHGRGLFFARLARAGSAGARRRRAFGRHTNP
jgi:hypothetical protein